jgi:hypothetical protein
VVKNGVARVSAVALGLVLVVGFAAAQPPPESKPAGSDEAKGSTSTASSTSTAPKSKREPIEMLPYRIRIHLSIDPESRIDARSREIILRDWELMIRRFVGAPWKVEFAPEGTDPTYLGDLEDLDPEALGARAEGVDKIWLIRIGPDGPGYAFTGREYDAATHRLGPLQRRAVHLVKDAARNLFQFSLDLFSPYALIGDHFGKTVSLTVRGAGLEPSTPVGRVVVPGAVFLPLRVIPMKDGKTLVRDIAFTYLRVDTAERNGATCSLVSSSPNPFTNRVVQRTYLAAIGIKPGHSKTRLRFYTLPDKVPAAGYVLTARAFPDGIPRDVGTTDREGRITLEPNVADGLTIFRLMAGSSEPMREFPLMPGATSAERDVPPFDPKPMAVTLETKLDSLRDEIIDLVAVRARLEARLKARYDGEDYAAAEAILKEINALPSRDKLAEDIAKLKADAVTTQTKKKTPILTRTAQSQFTDLQALVERYFDDDLMRGYADAFSKLRNMQKVQAKTKSKAAAPKKGATPKK